MDYHIWVQANRAFVWAMIAVMGFVTLILVLGGMQQYGAEGWGLIIAGVVMAGLTERVARYFLLPQMSVTSDALVIRPFWRRTVRWPYAETAAWGTQSQRIEKDWAGRQMIRPVTVERLLRTDHDGLRRSVVLPRFAGLNEPALKLLSERSGIAVEVQPD